MVVVVMGFGALGWVWEVRELGLGIWGRCVSVRVAEVVSHSVNEMG